jgi:hypothetical protein
MTCEARIMSGTRRTDDKCASSTHSRRRKSRAQRGPFDGNLSSLPNRFVYGETTQRCVSVHTAGMSEAMRAVYGADALAAKLESR